MIAMGVRDQDVTDLSRIQNALQAFDVPRKRRPRIDNGDLRAGASLILAALAADGVSTIHGAHHVQRGYENIERKFADVGARIARLEEGTEYTSS